MKNQQWEYKVGAQPMGFLALGILLAVFGGITVWLYLARNGMFVFTGLFAVFALLLTVYSVYQAIFVKAFIGETGFYIQTKPGNGRYYDYSEMVEAWEGCEQIDLSTHCCFSFRTLEGQVVRFPFPASQEDAFTYLLIQAGYAPENDEEAAPVRNRSWEYQIDGKLNGVSYMVTLFIATIMFGWLAVLQFQAQPGQFPIAALGFICITVVLLRFLIVLSIRYFCFKVQLDGEGFFVQTNPLNGKYYQYSDIRSCTVSMVTGRSTYAYFFVFTDKSGKTTRFRFEQNFYDYEIQILKERIEAYSAN
ncbi:MAG: hypothetical protein HFE85_02230 [Clostridiales bacterium]|nr:hypothetical protein [Clostridiales bacterium]